MLSLLHALVLAALSLTLIASDVWAEVRVKDITTVRGVRPNQLVGYGLVTGLKGTGDSLRNSPFTEQSMNAMLERLGVNVRGLDMRTKNVAAVLVTAELPAFAVGGNRIDISVASLADATSLAGGTLVMTPLQAADGQVYAVAQGSVVVAGFQAQGQSETLTHGVPTSGRIAGGALVERDAPDLLASSRTLFLELKNPDFGTAVAIVDAINSYTVQTTKRRLAKEAGPSSLAVEVPQGTTAARFLASIGQLKVEPDVPARIIIDERTGTIVISRNVKVSRVAVTHGNLTVRVVETPAVSQPAPFSKGQTVVTSTTEISAHQENGNFAIVDGVDLQSLVTGLNRMGLKPLGIIAILQAIKSAGALQADLVVQ
ncbi:MAG: flagellar basal body P-ring protein FlgI [Hyphomicrobium sp.]|uniref:flagellar basal body P-ring protein FlgI n=1 Tax=Hyphomicrobium sp. CS1BSMeth3 TaxID=1892844 RepID=UPI00086F1E73|nr:flagellar basal body P-ring protein FlgI [Hyphomicrobium sp. CS1BSMeth3]MBN9260286.1 flagellar basal body P-ring protein FlgI [Hyphomicrobium sp.]MBN9278187.1 flagellar basal body P-ring protein FlgI [Hyphomicrobium sp.]ODT21316.1 MAG: flagellar biosynthesis protein FlgI [Hyphomicrobium sp. SCN 65-11]OJU22366.1 MAG: flagellar biosynthesis protein FlgI [Alphaproteobacteria bacterium 64-6]